MIKVNADEFIRICQRRYGWPKSAENEGLNPRIFCGEGIPRGEKEMVDISTILVR